MVKNEAPLADGGASLADDTIWEFRQSRRKSIGRTQTFHLVATRQIPAGKIGGRVAASRTALRAHFAALLGGGA